MSWATLQQLADKYDNALPHNCLAIPLTVYARFQCSYFFCCQSSRDNARAKTDRYDVSKLNAGSTARLVTGYEPNKRSTMPAAVLNKKLIFFEDLSERMCEMQFLHADQAGQQQKVFSKSSVFLSYVLQAIYYNAQRPAVSRAWRDRRLKVATFPMYLYKDYCSMLSRTL
ncbi:unnamed protein product [Peronospora belbahrii]|uniref:PiggyBac transposable element-derived protein domain-containing protein n=1 Tax=Peronospora belbahrii TaxID=622444 RepID=A0AAU9KUV8_9STRA|nr:unnamed protein product [Peronospora belbahrii]